MVHCCSTKWCDLARVAYERDLVFKMAKADEEAKGGKTHRIDTLMPNLGGDRRQAAVSYPFC